MSRVLERLEELYAIGGGPGANRIGYSAEEDAAHELAAAWMREAGLEIDVDSANNLIGRRGDSRIWTGSHLDSVPNGGRFDGALGVVAAIEAAERLPDRSFTVVAFRAEENGPMGSRALMRLPDAFLELHVEQGPVLEQAGEPLGVVTSFAAQARGLAEFQGRADHAGTTPMAARKDALVEAARFIQRVHDAPRPPAVATVGAIKVEPNAANVVPAHVTVAVDVRAPEAEQLDALIADLGFQPSWRLDPIAMTGAPFQVLASLFPDAPRLVSGAGHDSMILAAAGVPTGMLFVRSLNGGASHSPEELTSDEDVAHAVDALTMALEALTARRS
jgi:acetylornithine deacetylase/succinyl-diaminopimelate desuccinylase-like protein